MKQQKKNPAPSLALLLFLLTTLCVAITRGFPAWAQTETASAEESSKNSPQNSLENNPEEETGFAQWRDRFSREIEAQGLSSITVQRALAQTEFLPNVIRLDRKQPEKSILFDRYVQNILTPARIQRGQELYQQHRRLLERIESEYGVAGKYIVALWGIETNYGQNTGKTDTLSALATLAYEGRRADFFRTELVHALRILDRGDTTVETLRGSWAGAMGQCQFMPSSFTKFAVDADGDGRRDIWGTLPDVFASTANYLAQSGWKTGEYWGREVRTPASIPEDWVGLESRRPLAEWARLGFRLIDGRPIPARTDMEASLVRPDGAEGRSFLVYDNYRVFMNWNRSTYFATTVGLLADRIAM